MLCTLLHVRIDSEVDLPSSAGELSHLNGTISQETFEDAERENAVDDFDL